MSEIYQIFGVPFCVFMLDKLFSRISFEKPRLKIKNRQLKIEK